MGCLCGFIDEIAQGLDTASFLICDYVLLYSTELYAVPQWILQADLLRLSFIISCICAQKQYVDFN